MHLVREDSAKMINPVDVYARLLADTELKARYLGV